jgi:hypothetical protein
LDKGILIEISG